MKFLQLLGATATFHGVAANNLRSRNAVEQVDECKDSYPCPGAKGVNSYCVDDFAPKRFKCGCMPGYTAIVNKTLIEGFYGSNDPVDVTWRPIQCIETNECLVGTHNCHENATCTNEVGSFKCECTGDLVGDGVNACIAPETDDEGDAGDDDDSLDTVSPCNSGGGCDPNNSVCNESTGFCDCKGGFFKTNMASPCNQDVNECESPELVDVTNLMQHAPISLVPSSVNANLATSTQLRAFVAAQTVARRTFVLRVTTRATWIMKTVSGWILHHSLCAWRSPRSIPANHL